jgi:hypothetical protein
VRAVAAENQERFRTEEAARSREIADLRQQLGQLEGERYGLSAQVAQLQSELKETRDMLAKIQNEAASLRGEHSQLRERICRTGRRKRGREIATSKKQQEKSWFEACRATKSVHCSIAPQTPYPPTQPEAVCSHFYWNQCYLLQLGRRTSSGTRLRAGGGLYSLREVNNISKVRQDSIRAISILERLNREGVP